MIGQWLVNVGEAGGWIVAKRGQISPARHRPYRTLFFIVFSPVNATNHDRSASALIIIHFR